MRAARLTLISGEYDIAVAVADRFPKLSIGFNYNFQSTRVSQLWNSQLGSILGNLSLPVIDGGRRRSVVREKKAKRDELIANFSQSYLNALQEVENALVNEKYQRKLLKLIRQRVKYSQNTLDEAKSRYINGLNQYLDVLVSLQALQGIERRAVSEHRALLVSRSQVYRSLGGRWTNKLKVKNSRKVLEKEVKKENAQK